LAECRKSPVDGAEDVRAQELRQLRSGRAPVVRLDRVADVGLIGEQPVLCGLQIGQVRSEADDRQARPRDVVLPELAHSVVERELFRSEAVRSRGAVGGHSVGGDGNGNGRKHGNYSEKSGHAAMSVRAPLVLTLRGPFALG
jgi:hypothetical protein